MPGYVAYLSVSPESPLKRYNPKLFQVLSEAHLQIQAIYGMVLQRDCLKMSKQTNMSKTMAFTTYSS